jgi:tRNA dimethylallyltransferase
MEKIVVILGPTASGKSALAVELAERFNGEIVSADSMQVYRFMDIGTAKPTPEERAVVLHHLLDVADPDEDFSAARFRAAAAAAIHNIRRRGRNVFVAGGTGLYIKALLGGLFDGPGANKRLREELLLEAKLQGPDSLHRKLREVDPEAAKKIHPNNLRRVIRALEVYLVQAKPISQLQKEHAFKERPYDALKIGISKDRPELYADIDSRVEAMISDGLLDETKRLLAMGYREDLKPMCALGYKEMVAVAKGSCTLEAGVELLKRNTRNYAKRQMTWFKKDTEIRWFYQAEKDEIIKAVQRHLA